MSSSQPTATRLVRTLLSSHPHLNTQQLWHIATAGHKYALPEPYRIQDDGKIRMKNVSNIREGKRIWVPPPMPRLPDHPFISTNFLKRKVLSSLESQGLIHKRRLLVPHRTDEERIAAQKQAAREHMRIARKAAKARLPEPPPKPPSPFTTLFAWSIGPPTANERGILESWIPSDYRSSLHLLNDLTEDQESGPSIVAVPGPTVEEHQKSPFQPDISPVYSQRWDDAERIEMAYRESKAIEAEAIKRRQEVRRKIHKEQREIAKAQREADRLAGRLEPIRREKERLDAIARIEAYAKQTGEDVSGWYEELGVEGSWEGDEGLIRKEEFERAEMQDGQSVEFEKEDAGMEQVRNDHERPEEERQARRNSSSERPERRNDRSDHSSARRNSEPGPRTYSHGTKDREQAVSRSSGSRGRGGGSGKKRFGLA